MYFNLYISQGGEDNGGRVIIGTPGSIIMNFFVAGKNGGCSMLCNRINADNPTAMEFDLELFMNPQDVKSNRFRMGIEGNLSYK